MNKEKQAQDYAHKCKCDAKGALKDNNIKTRGQGSGMRGKGFGPKS